MLNVTKLFVCKKPACYCHNAVTVYKYPHVEFEVSVMCMYSQREMFTFGAWNTRDLYFKEGTQKLMHRGEFWEVSNYASTDSISIKFRNTIIWQGLLAHRLNLNYVEFNSNSYFYVEVELIQVKSSFSNW